MIHMVLKIIGLDCIDCALKIETALNKEQKYRDVKVDQINNTISLKASEAIDISAIKKIVQMIEPSIEDIVEETNIAKYTYFMNGLDCADCANKLEAKLNKQNYIDA